MNNKNKQAIIIMHDIECEQYEGQENYETN